MTEAEAELEQPLISHLKELRDRLLKATIAIIVAFLSMVYFANDLYQILSKPLLAHYPAGGTMIATDVTSPFIAPFKLTMVLAIFVAMPYVLAQFWGFVAPGLYQKEKRFAVPMLISSVLLFYSGVAFAYFVLFPLAFAFFTNAAPEGVTMMTDINSYLDFTLKLFFAFGVAFEIPIAIIIMTSMGLTSVEKLREKRPYIIVGVFVIGMLLTPPDVISQTVLAVPMWLLYELGMLFSAIMVKPKVEATEAENKNES